MLKTGSILTFLAASLVAVSSAQAQHTFEQWTGKTNSGGDGTWDAGVTPDWNNGQVYVNSTDRNGGDTPAVSYAYFGSTPGMITVDNSKSTTPVTFGVMEFNSSNQAGDWTFQGDTLNSVEADNSATVVQIDNNQTANVTFNNEIDINTNPTNGGSVFVNSGSGTTLTLGAIKIVPGTSTGQTIILVGDNGTTTILNGAISTAPGAVSGLGIGGYGINSSATYVIKGALNYARGSNKAFDLDSGNLVLATSQTGTGDMVFVGHGNQDGDHTGAGGTTVPITLLTSGAQTINNTIYAQSESNTQVGGSTADISVFNGQNNAGQGGGTLDLHAAAGGRVIFNGDIGGNDSYVHSSGAGIVVLNRAAGNDYSIYTPNSYVVTQGTTLITNTSGSAFGSTSSALVQVGTGATLGGTGISTQTVVAAGPTSVLAPGDPGQVSLGIAPSIGTLHLNGGLTAANGLTMDFRLSGLSNDSIDFGGSFMALDNTVTINLTGTPVISAANDYGIYKILTDLNLGNTNDNSGANLNFVINAPTGYTVKDFGPESGPDNTTGQDYIYVQLAATPEPSTYAMLGLGLCGLVFLARRKLA